MENRMSGPMVMALVVIETKIPRIETSLFYKQTNIYFEISAFFQLYLFDTHLVSLTYVEQGAFIKPAPKPNKMFATNTFQTDDE